MLSRPIAAAVVARRAPAAAASAAMGASGRLLLPTPTTASSTAVRGLVTLVRGSGATSSSSGSGVDGPHRRRPRAAAAPAGAAAAAAPGARRGVFTYPAPRKLSDIMKVPLVRKCDPLEIQVRLGSVHTACLALAFFPRWGRASVRPPVGRHQEPTPPHPPFNTPPKPQYTHRRCGGSTTGSGRTRWLTPSRPPSSACSRTAPASRASFVAFVVFCWFGCGVAVGDSGQGGVPRSLACSHTHTTLQSNHRRVFLYPVFREQGYMTLISQFQDSCFLFTFLEDYRKNPQV